MFGAPMRCSLHTYASAKYVYVVMKLGLNRPKTGTVEGEGDFCEFC